jgi:S-DNA-T family DNA segregation ATPase FtsK/SpoIIIE
MKQAAKTNGQKKSEVEERDLQAENSDNHLLDRVASFWSRFDRFGWDIAGIFFIALGLITFLGLAGLTQGAVLSPWVRLLQRWMGWGSYLAALTFAMTGLYTLLWRFRLAPPLTLGRVLAVEGWIFSALALLSIWRGNSLEQAEAGMSGGLIGWGLVTLLNSLMPELWTTVVFIVLFAIFTLTGFGLGAPIGQLIEGWLLRADEEAAASVEAVQPAPEAVVAPVVDENETTIEAPEDPGPMERDKHLPPLSLLLADQKHKTDNDMHIHTAELITRTLAEFGIPAEVKGYRPGPTVTQYLVEPGFVEKVGSEGNVIKQKVRVSQVSALSRDLALALSAQRLRIEAPVPGQHFIGIEVPNQTGAIVRLRSILESDEFLKLRSGLALALGRDVSGQPVVADLARMPHLLIAGTTGSGKSICIAAITVCLAMNNSPEDLRLAMLDPKMVELVRFNNLPHLIGKVETQQERMLAVLGWALVEMDNRYKLLETARTRDLDSYNRKMLRKKQPTLPRIVIMIDELADLMMSAPDQTEHALVRLAQLARATGIHLIVATQRPSTDVVTGLIKANFPARVAFTVASSIDSRVILDTNGAETLLGRGDMLFLHPEKGSPQRSQGVMVTDQEVEKLSNFWSRSAGQAEESTPPWEELVDEGEEGGDQLVKQAIKIVTRSRRASASMLQRRLRVGYPRAARLIDELEELGVVGPAQGGGREREVLWDADEGIEGVDAVDDDADDEV